MRLRHFRYGKLTPIILVIISAISAASVFSQDLDTKGVEFYKQGQYKEANFWLKKGCDGDKKNLDLWNHLGLSYLKVREYDDARKAFTKATVIAPEEMAYQSNLASVNLFDGRTDKAQKLLGKILKADQQYGEAYYLRGISFL